MRHTATLWLYFLCILLWFVEITCNVEVCGEVQGLEEVPPHGNNDSEQSKYWLLGQDFMVVR